ncbi:MBL fold metallo-hydrolase [Vibrio lentus]|nr:MBL fold metallo-hydrolase [Vibrio lentus]
MRFGKLKPEVLRVDVLDVGHGLSVVLQKNNRIVVYDLGNAWAGGSVVESLLMPTIERRGIKEIVEGVIVSHFDSDHAGGYQALFSCYNPKWIRASQKRLKPQSRSVVEIRFVVSSLCDWRVLALARYLSLKVLWPPKSVERAYNPHSCVVRIYEPSTGFRCFLPEILGGPVSGYLHAEATRLKVM